MFARKRDGLGYTNIVELAVLASLDDCASGIHDYIRRIPATSMRRPTSITVTNEWISLYPHGVPLLPHPVSVQENIDPILRAISSLVRFSNAVSISLSGIFLSDSLVSEICRKKVHRLTLNRCKLPARSRHGHVTFAGPFRKQVYLTNITYLALGFGCDRYDHDELWTAFSLCTRLDHFYAYPSEDTGRVTLPSQLVSNGIRHLHSLSFLHIDGMDSDLVSFVLWSEYSHVHGEGRGKWQRLKLTSDTGFSHGNIDELVDHIGGFYPDLRILVLEGLHEVTPNVIASIGLACPKLQALGLVRRKTPMQVVNTICMWPQPLYIYVNALATFPNMEYFSANFEMTPKTCSSHRISTSEIHKQDIRTHTDPVSRTSPTHADPVFETSPDVVKAHDGEDVWVASKVIERQCDTAHLVIMVTRSLYSLCPKLRYFDNRAVYPSSACRILVRDDVPTFVTVKDPASSLEGYVWNPRVGETWPMKTDGDDETSDGNTLAG